MISLVDSEHKLFELSRREKSAIRSDVRALGEQVPVAVHPLFGNAFVREFLRMKPDRSLSPKDRRNLEVRYVKRLRDFLRDAPLLLLAEEEDHLYAERFERRITTQERLGDLGFRGRLITYPTRDANPEPVDRDIRDVFRQLRSLGAREVTVGGRLCTFTDKAPETNGPYRLSRRSRQKYGEVTGCVGYVAHYAHVNGFDAEIAPWSSPHAHPSDRE